MPQRRKLFRAARRLYQPHTIGRTPELVCKVLPNTRNNDHDTTSTHFVYNRNKVAIASYQNCYLKKLVKPERIFPPTLMMGPLSVWADFLAACGGYLIRSSSIKSRD
jgi:hypothetical protein